jgi:hypothetical protein
LGNDKDADFMQGALSSFLDKVFLLPLSRERKRELVKGIIAKIAFSLSNVMCFAAAVVGLPRVIYRSR